MHACEHIKNEHKILFYSRDTQLILLGNFLFFLPRGITIPETTKVYAPEHLMSIRENNF